MTLISGAKGLARRLIRKGIAWYVDPLAAESTARAVEQATQRIAEEVHRNEQLKALSINFELLKSDVWTEIGTLKWTIEELGRALAPGAGLAEAGGRLGELRERVLALERAVRRTAATSRPASGDTPDATTVPPGAIPLEAAFDYVGFERRFRGDPESVRVRAKERYLDILRAHGPVVDIGCGRGELLRLLVDEGVEARGVEMNPEVVAEAVDAGLDVTQGDGIAYLRSQPDGSLGAVVAIHVVEHLELGPLVELLDLARSRLRPGGILVAETPNPSSLIVLATSYILDPTHVRPLPPPLLAFLCETAGFRDVHLNFYDPATSYHLPLIDDPERPLWVEQVNAAFTQLNQVLFGPQDYSVTATTPPAA